MSSKSPITPPEKIIDSKSVKSRKSLRQLPNRSTSKADVSFLRLYETSYSPSRNESSSNSHKTSDHYSSDEVDESESREFFSSSGNVRFQSENLPESAPLRHKTPAPIKVRPSKETSRSGKYIWVFVVVIVVAVLISRSEKQAETDHSDKVNCSKFTDLGTRFPKQDRKLFKALRTGIEGTFNGRPPELSVFSLFSTDEELINKIMKEVVKVAMQCINQSHDPIDLKKEHLSEKLVADYKEDLMKRNIMIINNIDEASGAVVSSLHSFCDTYNPLVSKSVIFLTMKVPRTPTGKPVDYITEYLNERWKTLADNIRGPLITRMLDQTFFIRP